MSYFLNRILILVFILPLFSYSQNLQTSASKYTPQELIENVLINSNCIQNIKVTNVVGGNFNGNDKSYGYFNAAGTNFPFSEGLVLSTGKLSNVNGPNNELSDDKADNWDGDADLEYILNESNTTNATIIEFEFTAVANQVSFNYIFASEEYQENNSNTCKYSDLFGFLIKNKRDSDYNNIAVIPNTNIPVKVTTVHPDIPNGCDAQNEYYFGGFNNNNSPIIFSGQTKVLTAVANVQPNEAYQVKLVIADAQNYRYDSAVFLEAGSFKSTVSLGEDKRIATNNPLCYGEVLHVNATSTDALATYKWFLDNTEISGYTASQYTIAQPGTYSVEITDNSGCISEGKITVEYAEEIITIPQTLNSCDIDTDGLTFFDVSLADELFKNNNSNLFVTYFLSKNNAINNQNNIAKTTSFYNTQPNQVIYVRVENNYGCYKIEELKLEAIHNTLSFNNWRICDMDNDGYETFNLNEIRNLINTEYPNSKTINFFQSIAQAANNTNPLSDTYINKTINQQVIYAKVEDDFCKMLAAINLQVDKKPILKSNEEVTYCLNKYPTPIVLNAGIINAYSTNNTFIWEKDGLNLNFTTESIEVNESGVYKVTVANTNNCTETRIITVNTSETPTNIVVETTNKGKVSDLNFNVNGIGNYTYALDQGSFQPNPNFYNVTPGIHTIFINDENGCGVVSKEISIFGYPTFFSPNNDGINDVWFPIGLNALQSSVTAIQIYNRFGKLIVQLKANARGWDGTFKGVKLPSSDYWFLIQLNNGEQIKGNFTLIR